MKPTNLLVGSDGKKRYVKLTDFGLARALAAAEGKPAGGGPAADQRGAAATLYFLLAGPPATTRRRSTNGGPTSRPPSPRPLTGRWPKTRGPGSRTRPPSDRHSSMG